MTGELLEDANAAAETTPMLRIQTLGGFRVAIGQCELDERSWRLRKASALVKLLAITPGHRLHRERAIDALWPELSLFAGNNSLHRTLHAARHALNPARLPGAPARYLTLHEDILSLGPAGGVVVDASVFREAAAASHQAGNADAYRRAIALYGGDLLPDNLYDDWSTTAREELHELYCSLLAEAARYFAADAMPDEAIQTLRRLVAAEPTREEAHVALMRLLARLGRRYDALRQYQLLRAILCDELAAEPEIATQQLYEEIQSGRFPSAGDAVPVAVDVAARDTRAVGDGLRDAEHVRETTQGVAAAPLDGRAQPAAQTAALAGQVTSFVGRLREHEELSGLLAVRRLVTVVGAAGCGKTRLALHTAEWLRQTYADGVYLVELGALGDASLVPQAVALALGIREQADRPLAETLAAGLAPRHTLLVLDNCEHLRDACARLADTLLAACPRLRILATSRRPLGLAAESTFRLHPLAAPDPAALPPFAELLEYDAIRLFVERAAVSRPGFALTAQNADAVVRICRRLDGLPLAIELAAGRRRVLTIEQIAARLDDALALLGGGPDAVPRQTTLRAAIAWSWELLTEPERVLLRRLSVFAGGWTLDAAEIVCAGDARQLGGNVAGSGRSPDAPANDETAPAHRHDADTPSPRRERGPGGEDPSVLDLLARLVERSLVVVVEHGETLRYRLLDTIRQYASKQLRAAGEEEALRRQHAGWLLDFILAAELGLQGSAQDHWLVRLDAENDNLRAVLEWACATDEIELAGRIAGPANRYWYLRGMLHEGQGWLGRILALHETVGHTASHAVRARMLQESGFLAFYRGEFSRAAASCEESLRLWQQVGNLLGMNVSLTVLGGVAEARGDYSRAVDIFAKCLDLARELGDPDRIMLGLSNLADELVTLGELERARKLYAESLDLAERGGNRHRTAMALTNLGKIALRQGDSTAAEASLKRALAIMRALNIPRGAGEALMPLGELALARGAVREAIGRYCEALGEYHRSGIGRAVAQALDGLSHALAANRQALRAARLLGAVERLRESIHSPRSPDEVARYQEAVDTLRTQLGTDGLASALVAGRELSIEQIIASLPDEEATTPEEGQQPPAASERRRGRKGISQTSLALSPRERQIAELVAAGLTNREIAARLHIAPRTVDTHVANVLAKLDLRSRAEIGSWLR